MYIDERIVFIGRYNEILIIIRSYPGIFISGCVKVKETLISIRNKYRSTVLWVLLDEYVSLSIYLTTEYPNTTQVFFMAKQKVRFSAEDFCDSLL